MEQRRRSASRERGAAASDERLNLKAVEIATRPREGIDLGSPQQAIKTHGIKACILITTFQNPLGYCMPEAKQQELAALLGVTRSR